MVVGDVAHLLHGRAQRAGEHRSVGLGDAGRHLDVDRRLARRVGLADGDHGALRVAAHAEDRVEEAALAQALAAQHEPHGIHQERAIVLHQLDRACGSGDPRGRRSARSVTRTMISPGARCGRSALEGGSGTTRRW